ncbi:hypothetical protein ACX0MV_10730 [Pseudomonas borbori]
MTASETAAWLPLISYIGLLPLILVWLAGGAMALTYWRVAPRASQLCLTSMLILLAWQLVAVGLNLLVSLSVDWSEPFHPALMHGVINGVGNLVTAAAYLLLLRAVFIGRQADQGAVDARKPC